MAWQPLLTDILSLHGRWRAASTALTTSDETLDWRTLNSRANQVANGLRAAGCRVGSRVGIVMDNDAATLEVLFGGMKAGAIVVPLNLTISNQAIATMLADADVSAVFASASLSSRIRTSGATDLLCIEAGSSAASRSGWINYSAWRDRQDNANPTVSITREDLCSLIYSSGTTGHPKGIAHTHGARLDWAHDLAHAMKYHPNCRTMIATGLYSNISWASLLPTLLVGGASFVRQGFDAGDALNTVAGQRITHTAMVPVQYQRILEHSDFARADVSSMQMAMCCGAPLPLGLKEKLFDVLPCGLTELYGSTEGVVTIMPPEETTGRISSVGRPLPGEDLIILNDAGCPAGADEAGEIVALSRFAMSGYWANEEASREALWHDVHGRKWLRSGDIGRIDADGYLFITDRKKDMIISGGQNVYPADIEAVLLQHPVISDCAVFGVPSARWGETPHALVVLRDDAMQAAELLSWANARLGKQQRLSAIEIRTSLPRNANGKILKRDLRAPYWPAVGAADVINSA